MAPKERKDVLAANFTLGPDLYNPQSKGETIKRLENSILLLRKQKYDETNERIKKLRQKIEKLSR